MSEEIVVEKDSDILTMSQEELLAKHENLIHYTLGKKLGIRVGFVHPITGDDYDDFTQIGTIGLLKAKKGFKPSFGYAFSTYAVTKIQGEVVRHIRDGGKIKLSRSVVEVRNKIGKLDLWDEPDETIAELLDTPSKVVKEAKQADTSCLSFSNPVNIGVAGRVTTIEDMVADSEGEEFTDDLDNKTILSNFYLTLSDRESKVWDLHAEGKTQVQIGKIVGISQVHVSRTLDKVMKKAEVFGKRAGLQ